MNVVSLVLFFDVPKDMDVGAVHTTAIGKLAYMCYGIKRFNSLYFTLDCFSQFGSKTFQEFLDFLFRAAGNEVNEIFNLFLVDIE